MTDDTREVTAEDVTAAREEVIEALARSAEVYGAKRSYGRLFGILYFADEPLSMDDLVEESGYAKSTVSTAMSTLERFQLVRRRTRAGEGKRAFFEAEEDFWYIFQQFLDQRVRREIEMMTRSLRAAEMVLEQGDDERSERDLDRVRTLKRTYDRAETVVDAFATEPLDRLATVIEAQDGESDSGQR
jgi:DNA-binding transcriptional regulator GbsR (MarR family)